MTSQPLHSWQQISSICHHMHGLWHLIPYTCDTTASISVTSHPLWLWIHIHCICNQTHHVKTVPPLYLTSHPAYPYLCEHTHSIDDITHTMYVGHHTYYSYGTICTIYNITHMLLDVKSLYSWHQTYFISHHIHYIWQRIHCICVIKPRLSIT